VHAQGAWPASACYGSHVHASPTSSSPPTALVPVRSSASTRPSSINSKRGVRLDNALGFKIAKVYFN
jgi:hypothetical protein